jgi:hypothetical protein
MLHYTSIILVFSLKFFRSLNFINLMYYFMTELLYFFVIYGLFILKDVHDNFIIVFSNLPNKSDSPNSHNSHSISNYKVICPVTFPIIFIFLLSPTTFSILTHTLLSISKSIIIEPSFFVLLHLIFFYILLPFFISFLILLIFIKLIFTTNLFINSKNSIIVNN